MTGTALWRRANSIRFSAFVQLNVPLSPKLCWEVAIMELFVRPVSTRQVITPQSQDLSCTALMHA